MSNNVPHHHEYGPVTFPLGIQMTNSLSHSLCFTLYSINHDKSRIFLNLSKFKMKKKKINTCHIMIGKYKVEYKKFAIEDLGTLIHENWGQSTKPP